MESIGFNGTLKSRESWFKDRAALFNDITIPSVNAINNELVHLVFFSENDNELTNKYIDISKSTHPLFQFYTNKGVKAAFRAKVNEVTNGDDYISVNLDSDDALSPSYFNIVRDFVLGNGGNPGYYNVNNGIIWNGESFYRKNYIANPFITVYNRNTDINLFVNHTKLMASAYRIENKGSDWLITSHIDNISKGSMGRFMKLRRNGEKINIVTCDMLKNFNLHKSSILSIKSVSENYQLKA